MIFALSAKFFSDIWRNAFVRVVKTAFYVSKGTSWGSFFRKEFDFNNYFWTALAKNFRQCCQNSFLHVQSNNLRKNSIPRKKSEICSGSRFLVKIFWTVANNFRHGCQKYILCAQRKILSKTKFPVYSSVSLWTMTSLPFNQKIASS